MKNVKSMKIAKVLMITLTVLSVKTFAQTVETTANRNVNQQERIAQGLDSGALNTKEAAKLERAEGRVDHMEAVALKDGNVTTQEAERIQQQQNKVSKEIYQQKHDAQLGNPDSASSKRMQNDVERNVNQQQRIATGVSNGTLTAQETARLERGQAQVIRREAKAGADGHVGANEQAKIQAKESRESKRIHRKKHNDK